MKIPSQLMTKILHYLDLIRIKKIKNLLNLMKNMIILALNINRLLVRYNLKKNKFFNFLPYISKIKILESVRGGKVEVLIY